MYKTEYLGVITFKPLICEICLSNRSYGWWVMGNINEMIKERKQMKTVCNKCGKELEVKKGVNGSCECLHEYSWAVLWGTPDLDWEIRWDEVI